VNWSPTMSSQPVSQTVTAPAAASFSVTASGNPAPSYQWQKNGGNISGATSASYTTPSTSSADSGSTYQVVVTNSVGSVTSNSASLTVNWPPTISSQPISQTVPTPTSPRF